MSRTQLVNIEREVAEVAETLGEACRAILVQSPESVWVLSPGAHVLYYNHAAVSPVDLIGRRTLDFLKPEFHQEYEDNLSRVIDHGETVEFEFHSVIGQVWAQRFVPMRDQAGAIRWALAFGHEVQAAAQENIMPSRHLTIAVDTTGLGFWRWDARVDVVDLDRRSCVMHGLIPDVDARKGLAEFLAILHPDDRERMERIWSDTSQGEFRELEYRRVFEDGSIRWISCSGNFLVNALGAPPTLIGSFLDVTDLKVVSQQMVLAQKMEAVGQLTAGIAHNFNNILSAILPNLHLASRYVSEDGAKFIRNANLAAERATELVSELMVVAGRKEGQARLALDLYEVCERVVRICRTTFGGWVQLGLNCDEACPIILGNESQIEQVLLNLLLNARDAFEEASISCPRIDIELEASEEGGETVETILRVIDNGPGMSESTLQRIFEPFFTTKGAGTGLGLATAYAIVSDHGGTITCWSKPDQGTCFELRLPSHEGEVAAPTAFDLSSFVGGSERILVVDDDNLVRRVTSQTLRDAGYDVVEAAGGVEAIEVHQGGPVDLVLLDMAMPELTGDQVLEAMRTHDASTKVLIFTGLASFRMAKLERVAILQKPARINELLAAVRREIDAVPVHSLD